MSVAWIGLSKLLSQSSQFSVSKMVSGPSSSSLAVAWHSIRSIRWTFNPWVCPLGQSFAEHAGVKVDYSDSLHAANPSCWKIDQNAFMICCVSEINPQAVIRLLWAWDLFCVANRFWLPCNIYKSCGPWPFCAIFIPPHLSLIQRHFQLSLHGMLGHRHPISHNWLAQTALIRLFLAGSRQWFLTASSRWHPCRGQCWPQLQTSYGMMKNIWCATYEILAFINCTWSCWHHQLVKSSMQNVLLTPMRSEWLSLGFWTCWTQCFADSVGEFK